MTRLLFFAAKLEESHADGAQVLLHECRELALLAQALLKQLQPLRRDSGRRAEQDQRLVRRTRELRVRERREAVLHDLVVSGFACDTADRSRRCHRGILERGPRFAAIVEQRLEPLELLIATGSALRELVLELGVLLEPLHLRVEHRAAVAYRSVRV